MFVKLSPKRRTGEKSSPGRQFTTFEDLDDLDGLWCEQSAGWLDFQNSQKVSEIGHSLFAGREEGLHRLRKVRLQRAQRADRRPPPNRAGVQCVSSFRKRLSSD